MGALDPMKEFYAGFQNTTNTTSSRNKISFGRRQAAWI